MAQHETVEVASYLRDGSLWVGRFVVDGGGLDFGDDRIDSSHGLAKLANAEMTRSPGDAGRQVIAWTRNARPAAAESLKRAA